MNFENQLCGSTNLWREKIFAKNLKETRMGLNQQKQKKTLKPETTSGQLKETYFTYRHHVEPRVQLYVPKEESFPISQKFFDVTRSTHTNLDGETSSRIHVVWRAPDEDPSNYQRKQPTSKKRKNGAVEKPKLDNARKLRGIYFIDRTKETRNAFGSGYALQDGMKKAFKELREIVASGDTHPHKCACVVEAHESTRKRLESTVQRKHDDHIAEKGFHSLTHYHLVHNFSMLQAMKIPDPKGTSSSKSSPGRWIR